MNGDASTSYDFGQGYNWMVSQWPYIEQLPSGDFAVVRGLEEYTYFDSGLNPKYGSHSTLEHDGMLNLYRMTDSRGEVWEFQDFATGVTAGSFRRYVSPGNQEISATDYALSGQVARVERSVGVEKEVYLYQFGTEGAGNGRLERVTLQRQIAGTTVLANVWRVDYEYYGGDLQLGGSTGDLGRVTRFQPQGTDWQPVEHELYRYWKAGETGGFEHGLKYVLLAGAYEKLAADPTVTYPLQAPDETVARYADHYFEYDSEQRVTREVVDGEAHGYDLVIERRTGTFSPAYNHWSQKTTETLPDGSQNIVYTNYLSSVILRERKRGTKSWLDYFQFNDDAEVTLHAHPSAVIGYSFDSGNELVANLRSNAGLIERTEYYSATNLPAGEVEGHKSWERIQRGTSGTLANVRLTKYTSHTVTGTSRTIYPVLSETVYRTETGGAITTSYDYEFNADDARIRRQTTNLPIVSTAQNGDGLAHSFDKIYNDLGQLTWSRDALGFITYQAYDSTTGAVIQIIQDVDMNRMSGAPDNPGWSTPSGGGQHLITDIEVDIEGRMTQMLGPWHEALGQAVRRATWTVYDDVPHIVYSAQGYASLAAGEQGYSYTLINPVSISKSDADGNLLEQISAVRETTVGRLCGCDSFEQSSYRKWTTNRYGAQHRLISSRVYRLIPSCGTGEEGINYDEQTYAFDLMGRMVRRRTPGGTITRTVYDPAGRETAMYIGTDDMGATDADPTGGTAGITAGNNLALIEEKEYDDNDVGDGNLTLVRKWVNGTASRVTTFVYDWRNRLVDTDGEIDYFERRYYDNLNQVIKTERYNTTAAGNLIARQETKFDDWGRGYQTLRYGVNPNTGTVGNVLTDNTWYDSISQVLKQLPAGSKRFTKFSYDGLGRRLREYVGYDLDEAAYSEAGSVADDTIFEQSEINYDSAGNPIFMVNRLRYHNATGVGELQGPVGPQPRARVTYQANWFDPIGRQKATANYGTNGGNYVERRSIPPLSTDTVLVTELNYDNAGRLSSQIDPRGIVTAFQYDAADRQTRTIQNSVNCALNKTSERINETNELPRSDDVNMIVETRYNADGNVISVNAHNKATGNQLTQYIYGVTLSDSGIASTLLKRAEVYPDAADSTDRVTFGYNRQGEKIFAQDQNATVHEYDYDLLGRQTQDRVTTLGSGVDGAVRRIKASYEVRGMLSKLTSYDHPTVGSGNVINETLFTYNDFGQVSADYQSHSDVVDTATALRVEYKYANGSGNTIRPTSIIYPDGREIGYSYGLTNSSADALSRVETITDSLTGGPVSGYEYIGLSSYVQEDQPETSARWTLIDQTGSVDPTTGDIYTGFDRFSRVKDNRWLNYISGIDLDRFKYGYDRNGNRTWRENSVARADGFSFDEKYIYDLVNRLNRMDRGELRTNHSIRDKQFSQAWNLDATGNWRNFQEDSNGDGDWTLDQIRTNNKMNEITAISNIEGSAWIEPRYNRAGNISTMPQPGEPTVGYSAVYDAWNRLVRISTTAGKLAEYEYDGAKRRTAKREYISGVLIRTLHLYYTEPSQWQVIEERVDSVTSARQQYIWGQRFIDNLILRDWDIDENGTFEQRLYAFQDANWNVTAIADTSGVRQRFTYTPYGDIVRLTAGWSSTTDAFFWTILFGGNRFEISTGLYHIRNRVYNTTLGTWLQRDPLGLAAGVSLYSYCNNAPVYLNDPTGMYPTIVAWVVLVILVVIIMGILYRKYKYVPYTPVANLPPASTVRMRVLTKDLKDLSSCAASMGNTSLSANLNKMRIAGVLNDDYADNGEGGIGANALTRGGVTYVTNNFLKSSRCQQMYTLIHEASRVGGNYTEEDQPGYNELLASEGEAGVALACCLGCCDDPPGAYPPSKYKTPFGCCCDPADPTSGNADYPF